MKKSIPIILLALVFVFLYNINLIYAVPPVTTTQQFTEGLTIEIPQDNYLKVGEGYSFEFHVFNISNGFPIINGISCTFHLFNSSGDHIVNLTDNTASVSFDYSFHINSNNFTKQENFYYYIQCNNSVLGGYDDSIVYLNNTGEPLLLEHIWIYIASLFFLVLLILSLYYLTTKLPSEDARDEEGKIVQISWLKYLRPVVFCFMWFLLLACLFIISNIGIAYLPNIMMGNFFFVLWRIFFYFTMIAVPIYFIYLFVKAFQDKAVMKMIERGVEWN